MSRTTVEAGGAVQKAKSDEYVIVDRIVDRKENKQGQVFYLIKWKGYSDQDNTWEPEAHLADCPLLIEDFERRLRLQLEEISNPPPEPPSSSTNGTAEPAPVASDAERQAVEMEREAATLNRTGFERGLQPQKILGATDCGGILCFLMKWRGTGIVDIVPASEAKVVCPQVVIKFYESRFRWHSKSALHEMLENDHDHEDQGSFHIKEENDSSNSEGEQDLESSSVTNGVR